MTGTNLVVEGGVPYFDDAIPGTHAPIVEDDGTITAIPLSEYPVPAIYNDIYRSIDGGPWVLIATGVPAQGSIVDTTSAVVGASRYRAVAHSALPSAVTGDEVEVTIPRGRDSSLWLSRGEGYSLVGRAHRNHDIGHQVGPAEQAVYLYAGRTYPVGVESTQLDEVVSVAWDIFPASLGGDPVDQSLTWWQAWARAGGPVLLRDAESGVRIIGTCSGITATRGVSGIYRLSLTITKTRDAP